MTTGVIRFRFFLIYFNPIFCLKFSWLVWCIVEQVYYFLMLYYYIHFKIINNFLSFFWRYISFFRYFFIVLICNCLWVILFWIFWKFCDFIRNFISNQITSCICYFLNYSFWISFKCICCRLFSMIRKCLAVFTT